MFAREDKLVRWHLLPAFVALFLGSVLGLLQGLEHAGLDLYPVALVANTYYQGLTLHGVLNALVWTTFFISGFLLFVVVRALNTPLRSIKLGWAGYAVMIVGLVAAGYAMLSGQANVLYTFYPPLQAHPAFYIGLTLVVVGTWLLSADTYLTYSDWRKANPGAKIPLAAYGVLVTWIVWDIATIGVAAEMLVYLIPWSLGLVNTINPIMARTLFWYFGHPLVYFWLLPAYISWYTMLPKQAGGKLFSDPLARLALALFVLFSVPVGLHHQFTDPGISQAFKGVQTIFTFAVFFPSMITAFTVVASLETGGRARGGRGLFGWIGALPWGEPAFAAQALAMILFAFGGAGGLVNASYTLNLVVHNTTWIPGHFHLTVAAATTLSLMGVTYWLQPILSGRRLWSKGVAVAQAYTWFVGMAVFSFGMHWAGLLGAPRRVPLAQAPYAQPEWALPMVLTAAGGSVMFIGILLYFVNVVLTPLAGEKGAIDPMPVAEALSGAEGAPAVLERWRVWIGAAAVLVLIGYGPPIIQLLQTTSGFAFSLAP